MEFPDNAKIVTTASTASTEADMKQLLDNTNLPTTASFASKTVDENTHTIRTIGIYPSESHTDTGVPPLSVGQDGTAATAITKSTISTYYAGYLRRPDQRWPEKPFVLWADLHMKREHLHFLPHAAKALIDAVVRDEPGVLCYLWLQDLSDKSHLTVFECYVNKDACKAHEATKAYSRFAEAVGPYAEHLDINYAEWRDGMSV
ncbi:hypothetical protein C7212DRAFT_361728 [Tuber magnatum]|uniref:ABM domain-containing protein n=1 Tax=Tuber magnatum TaxID=42249 RepID=A0A317SY10_9PEZI|nr:hypothetical protein C7212DRAFT_361728 [Tuber magnatum]